MDVAHGEMVEAELTRLIEKRAALEDPEAKEALWLASVERYDTRRRDELRAEWCEYHRGQAERLRRTVEPLIAFHEARAAKLTGALPEGDA